MALHVEASWLVAGATTVLGCGGLWAYLSERAKLRRSPPAAQTQADADLVNAAGAFVTALGNSQQKHADELREEIKGLATKVDACEEKHSHCQDELAAERRERLALARRIDELMSGPIAGYGQPHLPGMGGGQ